MIEPGLIALATAATGIVIHAIKTARQQDYAARLAKINALYRSEPVIISDTGQFQHARLSDITTPAFSGSLAYCETDLIICPAQANEVICVPIETIQWVTATQDAPNHTTRVELHYEHQNEWRILHIALPSQAMTQLGYLLKRILPRERISQRPDSHLIGPFSARMVMQNLIGETQLGHDVSLYLLPNMLVVLADNRVQFKLNLGHVRRVLAVERVTKPLDRFIIRGLTAGMIRLHSMTQTIAFALPHYLELAEQISARSQCPLEHIEQAEKRQK